MTDRTACEWCGADGWRFSVRRDNITGLYLCGFCRARDLKCFVCRTAGREVLDDEVLCYEHAVIHKKRRAQELKDEFCELIGMNVQNQKLDRELVEAKKRYGHDD